jgi:hypothetical protein
MKPIFLLILILNIPSFAGIAAPQKCGTFPHFNHKLRDPAVQASRPSLQYSAVSNSGKFRIHYDQSGRHAVNLEDSNQNSIPDYIDSVAFFFDYANDVYVNQIGYKYPDDLEGGGSAEYDVYVVELGLNNPSYYGLTDADRQLPGGRYARYTSYILIDNNYSEKDSVETQSGIYQSYNTFGIEALKATAAHEYFHAVHFYYGLNEFSGVFSEMASSSMEIRVFPEVTDYYNYTRNLLQAPTMNFLGGYDLNNGYSYAVFGEYLFKKYGDDVMRRTWELVSAGIYHFDALDSALKENGANLKDSWTEFTSWLYYTGKRAQGNDYLNNAEKFPELKFEVKKYTYPSLSFGGHLIPLEISPQRIIFETGEKSQDTTDFIVTACTHQTAGYPNPSHFSYSYVISSENIEGSIELPELPYYFKLNADPNRICYNIWTMPGMSIDYTSSAFPQPLNPNTGESLFLPAPDKSFAGEKGVISIYTTAFKRVYTKELPVTLRNKYAVFEVNGLPGDMESGVYLFEVAYKDQVNIGKFAVIRK